LYSPTSQPKSKISESPQAAAVPPRSSGIQKARIIFNLKGLHAAAYMEFCEVLRNSYGILSPTITQLAKLAAISMS
ncbi:hypothetical protein PDN30_28185, partial [Bacillus cereus]|nr:hypothetical protein [Bacillus cereus]